MAVFMCTYIYNYSSLPPLPFFSLPTFLPRRSQHCEVEKRRREKMNRYMSELAQMIPACNAVPRKLDKLSVLRMAVDHMKNLRGTCIYMYMCKVMPHACDASRPAPNMLAEFPA